MKSVNNWNSLSTRLGAVFLILIMQVVASGDELPRRPTTLPANTIVVKLVSANEIPKKGFGMHAVITILPNKLAPVAESIESTVNVDGTLWVDFDGRRGLSLGRDVTVEVTRSDQFPFEGKCNFLVDEKVIQNSKNTSFDLPISVVKQIVVKIVVVDDATGSPIANQPIGILQQVSKGSETEVAQIRTNEKGEAVYPFWADQKYSLNPKAGGVIKDTFQSIKLSSEKMEKGTVEWRLKVPTKSAVGHFRFGAGVKVPEGSKELPGSILVTPINNREGKQSSVEVRDGAFEIYDLIHGTR